MTGGQALTIYYEAAREHGLVLSEKEFVTYINKISPSFFKFFSPSVARAEKVGVDVREVMENLGRAAGNRLPPNSREMQIFITALIDQMLNPTVTMQSKWIWAATKETVAATVDVVKSTVSYGAIVLPIVAVAVILIYLRLQPKAA